MPVHGNNWFAIGSAKSMDFPNRQSSEFAGNIGFRQSEVTADLHDTLLFSELWYFAHLWLGDM